MKVSRIIFATEFHKRMRERLDILETVTTITSPFLAEVTQRIRKEEEIIKSYKAWPGTIPSPIADKLIQMGMSKGLRVCLECYKLIPKRSGAHCKDCRELKAERYKHSQKERYRRRKRNQKTVAKTVA